MAVNDLTLPTWNTLDEARQKFIFQQLTRYFLSPLSVSYTHLTLPTKLEV